MKDVRIVVKAWFNSWVLTDWELMASFTTKSWVSRFPKAAEYLAQRFSIMQMRNFSVLSIDKISNMVADVSISCTTVCGKTKIKLRCVKEIKPYVPDIAGTWGVNPASFQSEVMI